MNMPAETLLVPVVGCFVKDVRANDLGQVVEQLEGHRIRVNFNGELRILKEDDWASGILEGFIVQDQPLSASRKSFGPGKVISTRTLAGREQASVHFQESGDTRWIPFEQLVRIMDPSLQFVRGQMAKKDAAERTAVNLMGRALKTFNDATGALSRLDVDPLPHQISLVHKIVQSGSANWIIADDVGLGKTIEVGLLLGALERKFNLRRILIIVPSGLTRQWKEEMQEKFDRWFRIYGRDFEIDDPREWSQYELVITSLDLVKPKNSEDKGLDIATRFGKLLHAPSWDLVIFDEAHRLSRDEEGRSTLRFGLAQALRQRTDQFLLLTGTPHQGDDGKFANLLRLVRPDLDQQIRRIDQYPEIVADMIIRNRKIDAVDINGEFLFKGVATKRFEIENTPENEELQRKLSEYVRQGYRAGSAMGGAEGRAIGFVMTIYRKLASSSVYALLVAMDRRRKRLLGAPINVSDYAIPEEVFEDPYNENDEDAASNLGLNSESDFFAGELNILAEVIEQGKKAFSTDPKRSVFKKLIQEHVLDANQNLLVFTEYRATQKYLTDVCKQLTGNPPLLIHGGMSVDQKREVVRLFEEGSRILISTEAGGEGLNLHSNCNLLVNYDLPWNPAKLSQRIGRLYRYGQKKTVVVLNLHSNDTIDNQVLGSVIDKLDRIVSGMRATSGEFDERYHGEVLGELLERLDLSEILTAATANGESRSDERIDDAIELANRARELQNEILENASAHSSEGWKALGAFTPYEVAAFIKRAAPFFGIQVEEKSVPERFLLRLPQSLKGIFTEFSMAQVLDVTTFRKGNVKDRSSLKFLDLSNSFVNYLLDEVAKPDFGGGYGYALNREMNCSLITAWTVCMQDDQGRLRGTDLRVAVRKSDGTIELDNTAIRPLFDAPLSTSDDMEISIEEMSLRDSNKQACYDRIEAEVALFPVSAYGSN